MRQKREQGPSAGRVAPKPLSRFANTAQHMHLEREEDSRKTKNCQFCGKKSAIHRCILCNVVLHGTMARPTGLGSNGNGQNWPCAALYHDESRDAEANGPCYHDFIKAGGKKPEFIIPAEIRALVKDTEKLSPTATGSKSRTAGKSRPGKRKA